MSIGSMIGVFQTLPTVAKKRRAGKMQNQPFSRHAFTIG
jgi:hypothetical protein